MNSDDDAQTRNDVGHIDESDALIPAQPRKEGLRHHVITRLAVERSGRLYSPHDWDFEIPDLEIYAAR
jgi:hypothetical protein